MAEDLISEIIDQAAIDTQLAKINGQLDDLKGKLGSFKDVRISFEGADNIKQLSTATKDYSDKLGGVKGSVDQLTVTMREYQKIQDQVIQLQARLDAGSSASAKEISNLREQIRLQNQETKNTILANQAAEGSIQQLRGQLALATKAYDSLSQAERNSLKGSEARDKVSGLSTALKQLEGDTGRYQRNVGNYTGALKTLEAALVETKAKFDQLNNSGKANTEQGQRLQSQVQTLTGLVTQQGKGFSSLTQEIRNGERALQTMRAAGLGNTESFHDMSIEVANSRREFKELTRQQQLLSSESPAIAGLTVAARGLAGAYAVGAGAAALFAAGDEKVEKELSKLVAIMTVLQGLNEFNKLLQERSAIATSLLGVKTFFLNSALVIKNFILKGTTTAQTANTVATEGAVVAEGQLAVATTAVSGAMVVLRTALIATGIGAILVLITSAAAAMSTFKKETDAARISVEDFDNVMDRFGEKLDAESENIRRNGKRVLEFAKQRGASEEELSKIRGQSEDELATHLEESANKQIEIYRKVAKEYGITIKGQIKTAEDAQKFRFALEDVKNKPEFSKEAEDKQKERLDATIKGFKQVETIFKQASDTRKGLEDHDLEDQTKRIEEQRKKEEQDAKKRAAELKRELQESEKIRAEFHKKDLEAIAKLSKDQLTITRDRYKEEVDDQNRSLDERIRSLQLFSQASKILIEREKQDAVSALDFEVEQGLKKAKTKGAVDQIRKYQIDKLKTIEGDAALATAKLEKDISHEVTTVIQQDYKKMEEAAKEAYDFIRKQAEFVLQNRSDALEISKYNKLLALQKDFHDKKIKDEEDYNHRKELIDREAREKELREEIKRQNVVLILSQSTGISNLDAQKKLKAALAELGDLEVADDKEKFYKLQKNARQIGDYYEGLMPQITNLVNNSFDAQISKLELQSKAIDSVSKKQIDAINASGLSAAEKTQRVTEVEKKAAFEKEQILKKEQALQLKKARFDKEVAILNIIVNTAKAIVADLGDPAKIVFDAAIGAAELAVAVAAPLPKFAKGTDSAPKGLGIYGEKGRELVIPKIGQAYLSPGVPSLASFIGGERIIPADMTAMIMNSINPLAMLQAASSKDRIMVDNPFGEKMLDVLKSIDKKPPVIVNVNNAYESTAHYQYHFKH